MLEGPDLNEAEIKKAARSLFEKIYPECDVGELTVRKHLLNYEIEAEMWAKPGCPSGFNPSSRYNLRLRVKAILMETPKRRLKP